MKGKTCCEKQYLCEIFSQSLPIEYIEKIRSELRQEASVSHALTWRFSLTGLQPMVNELGAA